MHVQAASGGMALSHGIVGGIYIYLRLKISPKFNKIYYINNKENQRGSVTYIEVKGQTTPRLGVKR